MSVFIRAAAATLAVGIFSAPQAAGYAATRHQTCARTYDVWMFERAARAAFSGTRTPTRGDLAHLARFRRCWRFPWEPSITEGIFRREREQNRRRRAAHAADGMASAVASVYDAAGGPIACGGDSYALGVANRTLPCGTRLRICFARCVEAVVFDRGPFVAGRDLDLSRAVQEAIGFPFGVATVRYAVGGM